LANGKFVHASTSKGVSVADLNNAYWSKYFSGAGRVRTPPAASKSRQLAQQLPPAAEKKQRPAPAPAPTPKPATALATGSGEGSSSSDVIIVFDEEF
jgi:hypothetical protein